MPEIKIAGHVMELKSGKCPMKKKKHQNNPWGLARFGPNKIWLSSKLCSSKQASILIHEIVEHLNDIHDIQMEHQKLSCLSEGIYQVVVDNPELVQSILRREALV